MNSNMAPVNNEPRSEVRQPDRFFLVSLSHPSQNRPLTPREMLVLRRICLQDKDIGYDLHNDPVWDEEIAHAKNAIPASSKVEDCFDYALSEQVDSLRRMRAKEIADATQLTTGSSPEEKRFSAENGRKNGRHRGVTIGRMDDGRPIYKVAQPEAPAPQYTFPPDTCMFHFNGLNQKESGEIRAQLEGIPGIYNIQHVPSRRTSDEILERLGVKLPQRGGDIHR